MGYRTFVDRDGFYWQVWDSQPTRAERRLKGGDRRNHTPFVWKGIERRTGIERRVTSQRRTAVAEGYGSGWLTFESLNEKRRLTPVPRQWEDVSQTELRVMCEKARLIARNGDSSVA